jgi:hypothetical protein
MLNIFWNFLKRLGVRRLGTDGHGFLPTGTGPVGLDANTSTDGHPERRSVKDAEERTVRLPAGRGELAIDGIH